jgi:hypothetical protein
LFLFLFLFFFLLLLFFITATTGDGPDLGNYFLSLLSSFDLQSASNYINDLYDLNDEWKNNPNTAINYYLIHSFLSYGLPAKGYHTSLPSGVVYINNQNKLTYVIYNDGANAVDVGIFQNDRVVASVNVGPGQLYVGN